MKQQQMITVGVVVIIGIIILAVLAGNNRSPQAPEGDSEMVACPQDAKVCPDGSSVGRVGPDCEFAACPSAPAASKPSAPSTPSSETSTPTPEPSATEATIRTGFYRKASALGVSLTPVEVTEDSRCPIDAQCVWAGVIKVRTAVENGAGTQHLYFELGKPQETATETITLTEVSPQPRVNQPIGSNQYVFTYEVKKK